MKCSFCGNELTNVCAICHAATFAETDNTKLRHQNEQLLAVLKLSLANHKAVYDAINKLAEDVWGIAEPDPDYHSGYYYRDEILHSIAGAIKEIEQAIANAKKSSFVKEVE